jgi:hypothetical protein
MSIILASVALNISNMMQQPNIGLWDTKPLLEQIFTVQDSPRKMLFCA